jgi:hypothetical protein
LGNGGEVIAANRSLLAALVAANFLGKTPRRLRSPRPSQAAAAVNGGPDPGPAYIRAELMSGGNAPKSITALVLACAKRYGERERQTILRVLEGMEEERLAHAAQSRV